MEPQLILLFSGKRKCGKDYLTDHLKTVLGDSCTIIKISEPIKSHWAKQNNLNLNELLGDTAYKEQYRKDMIKWSEKIRNKDYGYFCRIACNNGNITPIWIVSDIRRKTDIKWFKENYGDRIKTIRITADENTRIARGFSFQTGVDDAESECDLDNYENWDLIINNGEGKPSLDEQLESITRLNPILNRST